MATLPPDGPQVPIKLPGHFNPNIIALNWRGEAGRDPLRYLGKYINISFTMKTTYCKTLPKYLSLPDYPHLTMAGGHQIQLPSWYLNQYNKRDRYYTTAHLHSTIPGGAMLRWSKSVRLSGPGLLQSPTHCSPPVWPVHHWCQTCASIQWLVNRSAELAVQAVPERPLLGPTSNNEAYVLGRGTTLGHIVPHERLYPTTAASEESPPGSSDARTVAEVSPFGVSTSCTTAQNQGEIYKYIWTTTKHTTTGFPPRTKVPVCDSQ